MLSPVLFLVCYSHALLLPTTHPYKHPISPPPQKKHIYTPPTTETVHLSRLMRVHYNCCPFHKPASGVTHFLELVYNTVSLKKKYNQTDTQYNYAWFFEEQSCTYLVKNVCKPNRYQLCCQYPWPTIAVNISQWCLVRSQTSAGIHRLFVCLFTISNRQPIVNWLRASGRNWFRTIITTKKINYKKFQVSIDFLWCLLQHYAVLWNVVSPACKWTAGN